MNSSIRHITSIAGACLMSFLCHPVSAQSFYFGADLSYVNEMEDCGVAYKADGEIQDPYPIFKDRGCNLVRLRLWHTPAWYDNLNAGHRYSDLDDVSRSIQRAKEQGMEVLLAFHLSDTWSDPGNQVAPQAWWPVVDDLPVLQDSLYMYIHDILARLAADGLLPEMVQIGNETNKGILLSKAVNDAGWSLNWPRNAALFNTAIDAVRDAEAAFGADIRIALHIANPSDAVWYFQQFHQNGVTDFDIIGLSYYRQWHNHTIPAVGNYIFGFRQAYPDKEVMILETGLPWTTAFADGANNVLNTAPPGYTPSSPQNQLTWLTDLAQTVIDRGGAGMIYWEPAWVSTSCRTQWAQGSHWENCAFFDFEDELITDGGVGWMAFEYDFPVATDEATPETGVKAFPNPASAQIIILTSKVVEDCVLYGMQGLPLDVEWSLQADKIVVRVDKLPAGLYVIHIRYRDDYFDTIRFVVTHDPPK